ncbi:MAG: alpha/beta hydrolase-fold protein [Terracidiphilus sp.]
MRRLVLALLLACSVTLAAAQNDYTLGPDSQPQPGVPTGTVTHYTLPPGKFYPGTPHHYAVYVPAQYDPSKPTPFMIFLDGSQALGKSIRVPTVFDNLISKHEIPSMIGIFVDPGVLPALSDQDQNRYGRIFEYDSLSPRFSSFLLDELIPAVAAKYNLSTNPDDRALSGVSTGAVGAFMAAWNRPDQFHRVLSFIGTYVAMKGADSLPAMIRKTEPKPIRIFMQDGSNDHIVPAEPYGIDFAGSWPINNEVMYQAFEYAGYDVKLVMGHGTHSMNQGGAIMPEALRWLWRDYPQPIVVHEPAAAHEPGYDTANRVFSTIYLDKPWEQIGGDYGAIESLTSDRNGNVYLPDQDGRRILRVDPQGTVTLFAEVPDSSPALVHAPVPGPVPVLHTGPGDRLYAFIPGTALTNIATVGNAGSIVSWSIANGVASDEKVHATADKFQISEGMAEGVVDFAVTQNGTIYALLSTGAKRIDPSGRVSVALVWGRLLGEMGIPARITLSPDQSMAVMIDQVSRYGWSFQIAADGSLQNGEPFYRLEAPEAIRSPVWGYEKGNPAEDTNGMVYFPTPLGIQIAMQNGRIVEILNPPVPGGAPLTAIAFATSGNTNWLYVAQDGKLYRRPVKVMGANAWTVVKPPKPTL